MMDCGRRQLKTQAQIEHLERCYAEHKYPSEDIKEKLALDLTLSYKQVDNWFCHRRQKDKKAKTDGNRRAVESLPCIDAQKTGRNKIECQLFCAPAVDDQHARKNEYQHADLDSRNQDRDQRHCNDSEKTSERFTSVHAKVFSQNQCSLKLHKAISRRDGENAFQMQVNTFPCRQNDLCFVESKRRKLELSREVLYPGDDSACYVQETTTMKEMGSVFNEISVNASPSMSEAKKGFGSLRHSHPAKASGGKLCLPPCPSMLAEKFVNKAVKPPKHSGGKLLLPPHPSRLLEESCTPVKQSGGKLVLPPCPSRIRHNDIIGPKKDVSEKQVGWKFMPLHSASTHPDRKKKNGKNANPEESSFQRHTASKHVAILHPKRVHTNKQKVGCPSIAVKQSYGKLPYHMSKDLEDDDSVGFSSLPQAACPERASVVNYPPPSLRMRPPFLVEPWKHSHEDVKLLFMAFKFLYSFSGEIMLCPFTLDQFVQAFHDSDSKLLGEIHISLLSYFLRKAEHEIELPLNTCKRSYQNHDHSDCNFSRFIYSVRSQRFKVKVWQAFLNPLTWPEILRQVLIEAGFGSNQRSGVDGQNKVVKKEETRSHGLIPGTLKHALFHILRKCGIAGLKISEIAKQVQKCNLIELPSGDALHELLRSTLLSDITLFERISSSSFRLRGNLLHPGDEEHHSCLETMDVESSSEDSDTEREENLGFEVYGRLRSLCTGSGAVRYIPSLTNGRRFSKSFSVNPNQGFHQNKDCSDALEIDESQMGDAWVLGLFEGDYTKFSIKEKLNALVALIKLTGSGSSIQHKYKNPSKHLNKQGGKHLVKLRLSEADLSLGLASNRQEKNKSKSKASNGTGPASFSREAVCLGTDRMQNLYWQFFCHNFEDPGRGRVYFESSEDGHWAVIDTEEGLQTLMSSLDPRHTREALLIASLKKRENFIRQQMRKVKAEKDLVCQDSSSVTSVVENSSDCTVLEHDNYAHEISGAISVDTGKITVEKQYKCDRSSDFDKWVWKDFFQKLEVLDYNPDRLQHCKICNDLFWPEEGHCIICHITFELDFDSEERYAVHVARCKQKRPNIGPPEYKLLASPMQSLKAAMQAIEGVLPQEALEPWWRRSRQNVWIKHLRHASSTSSLAQVVTDLQSAIRDDWLHGSILSLPSNSLFRDLMPFFTSNPQTIASMAFWLVALDAFISNYLKEKSLKQMS